MQPRLDRDRVGMRTARVVTDQAIESFFRRFGIEASPSSRDGGQVPFRQTRLANAVRGRSNGANAPIGTRV
eukprot:2888362-Heterocapsa_arctica.AAC.1